MGSRDIYVRGHSRLMGTKCDTLEFSHSVWKGVSMILSVNIISLLPFRLEPSKSHT